MKNENIEISLYVKEERFKLSAYIARVNREILPHIKRRNGYYTNISNGKKRLLVKLQSNPLINKDTIFLTRTDMEKLDVEPGDTVNLKAERSVLDILDSNSSSDKISA
jgi:hypothetical protein